MICVTLSIRRIKQCTPNDRAQAEELQAEKCCLHKCKQHQKSQNTSAELFFTIIVLYVTWLALVKWDKKAAFFFLFQSILKPINTVTLSQRTNSPEKKILITTKVQLTEDNSLNSLSFALVIRTKNVAVLMSINYAYLYSGDWLNGSFAPKLIQFC